jgi:exodeoxyribonuclease VII small subunit
MTSNTGPTHFEVALSRLEEVVSRLESGELTLAESLRTFEEGVDLSRQCAERLNQVEARIEYLIRTADGAYAAEPFSLASDGGVSTPQ